MSRRADREGVWTQHRRDVLARRAFSQQSFGHILTRGENVRDFHRRVMAHLRERPVLP